MAGKLLIHALHVWHGTQTHTTSSPVMGDINSLLMSSLNPPCDGSSFIYNLLQCTAETTHTHMNKPQGSCFVSNQHFNAAGILREKYWMVIHERKKKYHSINDDWRSQHRTNMNIVEQPPQVHMHCAHNITMMIRLWGKAHIYSILMKHNFSGQWNCSRCSTTFLWWNSCRSSLRLKSFSLSC